MIGWAHYPFFRLKNYKISMAGRILKYSWKTLNKPKMQERNERIFLPQRPDQNNKKTLRRLKH